MIACRVPVDAAGEDTGEGFHILVGGGVGSDAAIGREIYRDVKVVDCPRAVERRVGAVLAHRRGDETFLAFTRRHEVGALKAMIDGIVAETAV
jgi:ferredoxin-nitrite reductase